MRSLTYRRAWHACVRAICAALALFAFLFTASARAEIDGMLRVKLARLGSPSEITMKADCDYYVVGDPSVRLPSGTELTVSAEGGRLTLTAGENSLSLGGSVQLTRDATGSRGMTFLSPSLSNRFCGDLMLTASGDAITAVLRIYVEDYLYGVVGYEMAPSSAPEALKAQAIVARNYALRQKASRGGSAYDLSDSGDALCFRGYNSAGEYAGVLRAVDDTRGQVACYDDSPATCYFCESNGGQTESAANALGVSLPYSQVMDDPYDYDGAGIKKTAALRRDGAELHPFLEAALIRGAAEQLSGLGVNNLAGVRITAIEDVAPESPRFASPSRLYQSLAVTASFSGQTPSGETVSARATVRVPTYGGLEDWYELGINDENN